VAFGVIMAADFGSRTRLYW